MSIGGNMRRMRKAAGLTQAEVAARVSVHQTMINQIEMERKAPTLVLAKQIADVLGCDVTDFLDGFRQGA